MLNFESRQNSYTLVILAAISSTILLGTISSISTNVFEQNLVPLCQEITKSPQWIQKQPVRQRTEQPQMRLS